MFTPEDLSQMKPFDTGGYPNDSLLTDMLADADMRLRRNAESTQNMQEIYELLDVVFRGRLNEARYQEGTRPYPSSFSQKIKGVSVRGWSAANNGFTYDSRVSSKNGKVLGYGLTMTRRWGSGSRYSDFLGMVKIDYSNGVALDMILPLVDSGTVRDGNLRCSFHPRTRDLFLPQSDALDFIENGIQAVKGVVFNYENVRLLLQLAPGGRSLAIAGEYNPVLFLQQSSKGAQRAYRFSPDGGVLRSEDIKLGNDSFRNYPDVIAPSRLLNIIKEIINLVPEKSI